MPDLLAPGAIMFTASPNYGAPQGVSAEGGPRASKSIYDWGTYNVAGTVKIDSTPDIPVKRRVRLLDGLTYRVVAETWSDPVTGGYSFPNVRIGPWLIVAADYTGDYNAVVADNVLGVPV